MFDDIVLLMSEQNRSTAVRLSALSLGLAALTACGNIAPAFDPKDATVLHIERGLILKGTNIRSRPEIATDQLAFSCFTTTSDVEIGSGEVQVTAGIEGDSNGQWVSLNPRLVHRPLGSQINCPGGSLYGGTFWVNANYIELSGTSSQLLAPSVK